MVDFLNFAVHTCYIYVWITAKFALLYVISRWGLLHKGLFSCRGHYRQVPPELRVDRVTWVLSDMQYADVEMRRLLLDLVDEKIFKVQPGLDKEADAAQNLRDKTEQYTVMQAKVKPESTERLKGFFFVRQISFII